jgi:hydrophobic/amphiphilic exporter-1 (mainly G- bacteria), HAE1 family
MVDDISGGSTSEIIPQLPPGLTLKVSRTTRRRSAKIVAALEDHLLEGTMLAGLVCGSSCAASARR